jgi:site-specific recombinase XerD
MRQERQNCSTGSAKQCARARYSPRTEAAYVDWIKRYIRFHGIRHPQEMGAEEVKAFLSHLATQMNVAASTQNQAFSALLFLCQEVLKERLPWIDDIVRAKRPAKLPVVFTQAEARAVLSNMHGTPRLMAHLLYGSGLRVMEYVRLRIKDVDLGYMQITLRDAKGGRHRVTMVPVVQEVRWITSGREVTEADWPKLA